jgi:predicted RNase H-like HicB family nuclease
VVLYEAAPEGGFVAVVPALPGCHSQGANLEEAGNNVQEAIELYLESLMAPGDPIPLETRIVQGIVTVTLPAQL